jgi:hypothetical protein
VSPGISVLVCLLTEVLFGRTAHHSNGSKHSTAAGYDWTGWPTFKAHFYTGTQEYDELFFYSVNPNLAVPLMRVWKSLLGEKVTTLVYSRRLDHNNLITRRVIPVSGSFIFCPLSSDIFYAVYIVDFLLLWNEYMERIYDVATARRRD